MINFKCNNCGFKSSDRESGYYLSNVGIVFCKRCDYSDGPYSVLSQSFPAQPLLESENECEIKPLTQNPEYIKHQELEQMKDIIAQVYIDMFNAKDVNNDNYAVFSKLSIIEATIGDKFLRAKGYDVLPLVMDGNSMMRALKVSKVEESE